ncbi:MAG: hypothetical protein JWN86_3534 [Planctomycetota bacterium]|nr:hypothetical protein [Planctomycetota bacterium]
MPAPAPPDSALALVLRGWEHLRLQRPLAAWASWQRALRIEPEDGAATEALEILEAAEELPIAARLKYKFRSPEDYECRTRWSSRFAGRNLEDLSVAAEAFASLAYEDENDGAARFNEALCLAWLGENAEAIVAMDLAVRAEADRSPESAVASWSVAEILRQGAGAEIWADDLSHALILDWAVEDGDPLLSLSSFASLQPVPPPLDPVTGKSAVTDARVVEWLDRPPGEKQASPTGESLPHVLATVIATPGRIRLSSPDRESLETAEMALLSRFGDRARSLDRRSTPLPLRLMDAAAWLFRMPASEEDGVQSALRRAAVERYFEQVWITRPRLGLSGRDEASHPPLSPVEAAVLASGGDSVALAKLSAVVNIREQLSARPHVASLYEGYPFDRLRRRLGLPQNDPSTVEKEDVSSMGRAELVALDPKTLSRDVLADACVAAMAVCDAATIERFEAELASRPQDC